MMLPISASDNSTDVGVSESYTVDNEELQVNEINDDGNDELLTENDVSDSENEVLSNGSGGEQTNVKTSLVVLDRNVVKEDYLHVQLLDENSTGIPNKVVKISIVGKTYNCTTDKDGIAKLKIQLKYRDYPFTCQFSGDGYIASKASASLFVVPTSKTSISAPVTTIYYELGGKFQAVLKAGSTPLPGKTVYITISGKTYVLKTDSKGVATLPIGLKSKNYPVVVEFKGGSNLKPVKVSSTVKVVKLTKTKFTVTGDKSFIKGIVAPFVVKLTDSKNSPLAGKTVFITVAGKTYTVKTNSKGEASLPIGLKKGSYPISYKFNRKVPYEASKGSSKIVVNDMPGRGAIWIFGYSMKSTSLSTLANAGIKDVFLNYYALNLYGRTGVVNWIKQANSKGIRVHIWMQVFWTGDWVSPVTKSGSYQYSLINSKVNEAKSYARIPGVSGVHFDYLRFPGTAYKYKNAVAGVNYFTQKASSEIHKINPKCIVSAAIMPEYNDNKYYYGQDAVALSKYLDVLVPMVYKGNYHAGTNWIKTTTAAFVKAAGNNAQVWTGLQSYRSDDDVTPLSYGELYRDAAAAKNGGAKGVALFRYGLTAFVNVNKLFA